MKKLGTLLSIAAMVFHWSQPCRADGRAHTFTFGGTNNSEFLLDGKPFQIRGGEMHPGRIPPEYWRHRIQMAKAMGLNTIPIYVFWNDHERVEGKFDFTTGGRNIGAFLRIASEECMWVILRPGPFVCAEWDLGGLPSYLLRDPTIKLRCSDPRYTKQVERYLVELAKEVRPFMVKNGGPILMVQIENEYGSFPAGDKPYLLWLRDLWIREGVEGPFCTADGARKGMLTAGTVPGAAVGLDADRLSKEDWELARKVNPGVPVFASELYPGWLRHWYEGDWSPKDVTEMLKFCMTTKKSFCLYVFHGGSNFGFTAGANGGGKGKYEPSLTSYDYGAPLGEQGNPTPVYHKYRQVLAGFLGTEVKLPDIPAPIPTMTIPPIALERWTTLWDAMPQAVEADQPAYFESALLNQNQGIVNYRTTLPPGKAGTLKMDQRDYAQVFLDGKNAWTLNRIQDEHALELPAREKAVILDILVEAMGHINMGIPIQTDRKGLVGDVTLDGVALKAWKMFPFPLKDDWIQSLPSTASRDSRPGGIFKGAFTLDRVADTYLDMSQYKKGVVWINGHNLGRYWCVGSQKRLYCPASWLKQGENTLMILDLEIGTAPFVLGTEKRGAP